MKLRDLMGATLRFLQSDCAKFRMLWDWSPCMSLLLTSDVMVRWYVPASCLDLDIIRYRYWIFNMGKSVLEKNKNGKLFLRK